MACRSRQCEIIVYTYAFSGHALSNATNYLPNVIAWYLSLYTIYADDRHSHVGVGMISQSIPLLYAVSHYVQLTDISAAGEYILCFGLPVYYCYHMLIINFEEAIATRRTCLDMHVTYMYMHARSL